MIENVQINMVLSYFRNNFDRLAEKHVIVKTKQQKMITLSSKRLALKSLKKRTFDFLFRVRLIFLKTQGKHIVCKLEMNLI